MEVVEEDVQCKHVIADVEKGYVMEQLDAENKRLLDQLEDCVAEKDEQIAETEKQITERISRLLRKTDR